MLIDQPAGATHQHLETGEWYRVTGRGIFRLGADGGWYRSTLNDDDVRREMRPLRMIKELEDRWLT